MSTSKVFVKANLKGEIISQNPNKPEFGYFLVKGEEGLVTFGSNGFANEQFARQCIVPAPWSLLERAVSTGMKLSNGSTVVLEEGAEIPGKIVIWESVNQGDLYDVTKVNGDTGIKFRSGAHRKGNLPYCSGDQPIYQKKFFTEDLSIQDKLVPATNGADILAFTNAEIARGNTQLLADFKVTPAARTGATRK